MNNNTLFMKPINVIESLCAYVLMCLCVCVNECVRVSVCENNEDKAISFQAKQLRLSSFIKINILQFITI